MHRALPGQAALMRGKARGYAQAMMPSLRRFALAALLIAAPAPLFAQDAKVPYWASIRAEEVNMRVGPGEDYRIAWVYRRVNLPLKVVRLKEGWRLVEDPDGARGWILSSFLTRARGAIVKGEGLADMREKGDPASRLLWRLEPGVTGRLGACAGGWCQFDVGGRTGFAPQDRLWGADEL